MKPVFKSNLYFLIVLIVSIFLPQFIVTCIVNTGISLAWLQMTMHIILFIIPAIIYIIVTKSNIKRVLKLNKLKFKDFLRVILIVILSYPVMGFLSYLSKIFFRSRLNEFMDQLSGTPFIVLLIVMAVTPAITEEITIRGIVLSGYSYKNKKVAAVMTGIMFGIMHLNPEQFLYAFALGVIFARLVRATDSIYSSMIAHFLINGSSLALTALASKLVQTNSAEVAAQLESVPMSAHALNLVIGGIIAAICFYFIDRILKDMEKKNIRIYLSEIDVDTKASYEQEKVINIPFILSVIIFLAYTILLAYTS